MEQSVVFFTRRLLEAFRVAKAATYEDLCRTLEAHCSPQTPRADGNKKTSLLWYRNLVRHCVIPDFLVFSLTYSALLLSFIYILMVSFGFRGVRISFLSISLFNLYTHCPSLCHQVCIVRLSMRD